MIQCPACGAQNADYARECAFCGTDLERPPLKGAAAELRDQLLGMSLGTEDFNTICFALDVDWHHLYDLPDEAGKIEILVRQLEDEGRLDEVARFLRDFRFPTDYPPLPRPPADNLYLTYVYACQNVESFDQLQRLAEQVGISDASQLPGAALPHKIREVLWAARRANALPQVHDWLRTQPPEEQLTRPRIRDRRSRVRRPGDAGPGGERGRSRR
ncbi:MAG TPA: zinc ribbon domain-containing protein [Anaerolineae bacterium]|nr:zinc ribbon domain-containing protein [Anaerolineae bacterium]